MKENRDTLTGKNRLQTQGTRDQLAAASHEKKEQTKEQIKTWIDLVSLEADADVPFEHGLKA